MRATITSSVIERSMGILMAVAATGFGALTAPTLIGQLPQLDPFWGPLVAVAVAASIVFVGASAVFPRLARPAQGTVALVLLAAIVTWPLTVPGSLHPANAVPWIWSLCNVGTIAAALVLSEWRAVVYTFVLPAGYIVDRCLPEGGGVPIGRSLLDGVYIMILGGAALVLIVVLRRTAAAVDAAQATAVQRYTRAIREHATELERVQVDALVHDSVLTTLISAARAETADAQALASSMATNALRHLSTAAVGLDTDTPPVSFAELRARILAEVTALAAEIPVRAGCVDERTVPAPVADALVSAAVQAAVNSVQHAGDDAQRWIVLTGLDHGGVRIEVADDGRGFDIDQVPAERLGVRRSILERVAATGAEADLTSAPGAGTRVVLTWPARVEDRGAVGDDVLSAAVLHQDQGTP